MLLERFGLRPLLVVAGGLCGGVFVLPLVRPAAGLAEQPFDDACDRDEAVDD